MAADRENPEGMYFDGSKFTVGCQDRDSLYLEWLRLMNEYSRRQLSHSSDRLQAIQGIATEFQHRLKDNYLAGLWEGDLVRSLVWRTFYEDASVPDYSRAPSWSWASLDSGIFWEDDIISSRDIDPLCMIVSTTSDLRIEISGLLCEVDLALLEFASPNDYMDDVTTSLVDGQLRYTFDMDGWRLGSLRRVSTDDTTSSGKPSGFEIARGKPRVEELKILIKGAFLLHMYCRLPGSIVGLVLMPEIGMGKGTFRRIGMFRVSQQREKLSTMEEDAIMLDQYTNFVRAQAHTIGPEFYVRQEQGGDCTVHLV